MIPEVESVINELDGHRIQFMVLSRRSSSNGPSPAASGL